jgi:hypothetical protein
MLDGHVPPRLEHECAVGEREADLPEPYPHGARDNVGHGVEHDGLKGKGKREMKKMVGSSGGREDEREDATQQLEKKLR